MRTIPTVAVTALSTLLLLATVGGAAAAQQPAHVPDSLLQQLSELAPPLVVPAGAVLEPGSWQYRVMMARGGETIELARRTVTVQEAAGDPALWLLVEETDSHGRVMADSTFVRRTDLGAVRRSAHLGPVHLVLTFGADSVRGWMTAPGGDTLPVSLPVVPGLVGSSAALESLLTTVPLDSAWAATVVEVAPGPAGVALVPVTLRVERLESLAVPAGQFTAWRISASGGGSEQWLWAAADSGRLLRLEMTPPQSPDVHYLTVLEAAAPPP